MNLAARLRRYLAVRGDSAGDDAPKYVYLNRRPSFDASKWSADNGFTIENIEVRVEMLDTDQNIELLAEKVGKAFEKSLTKRTSVGGVRMG